MIYTFVFQDTVVLPCVWLGDYAENCSFRRSRLPHGLLLACNQAYRETVDLYYKTAIFKFEEFELAVQ